MANYLFDKYNVAFGSWSGEFYESYESWVGGSEIRAYGSEPTWDGSRFEGRDWNYYGIASSVWNTYSSLTEESKEW